MKYLFIIRIYAFLAHSMELHPSLLSAYAGLYVYIYIYIERERERGKERERERERNRANERDN